MEYNETKHLIVISGNMGVGKTTFGPKLAKRLNAVWLPENLITEQFPYLIADQNKDSKLIAEIAFASLRTAMIISTFLKGENRIVMERYLWDDRIFFDVWSKRFGLSKQETFISNLFSILESHHLEYKIHTIFFQSQTTLLQERLQKRNKVYDHTFSQDVIDDIQKGYQTQLSLHPTHLSALIDVSDLNIQDQEMVEDVLNKIINALPKYF